MSGFQDNPFGEPMVDNPFADPAIQQVAQNTTSQQRGLEDYNPFEEENAPGAVNRNVIVGGGGPAAPASSYTSQARVPGSQNGPGSSQMPPQLSLEDFHRRQAELDQKAAELDRREREINAAGGGAARLNNWPPLPEKCCFQPCFYHDIDQEIRFEFQRTVRNLYYVWILYAGVLLVNVLGALILMIHSGEIKSFISAVIFAFLFTPASFLCWYRPAYKAFKSDSSFDFMVFFFIFFCQTVVTIIQTTLGFITAISNFGGTPGSILLGIFLLIIACGFGVCAAGDVMMLSKIHSIYRNTGASVEKARNEFADRFMSNQHVQQAATSAASAVINSQMSGGNNGTGPRY